MNTEEPIKVNPQRLINENPIEICKLLKSKKTGKIHCPICLGKLKLIKFLKSNLEVFYCSKDKLYFQYNKQK